MPIDPRRIEVIDDQAAAAMRRLSPQERLAMANTMVLQARSMIALRVRTLRPDWNEEEIAAETRRRMTGGTN